MLALQPLMGLLQAEFLLGASPLLFQHWRMSKALKVATCLLKALRLMHPRACQPCSLLVCSLLLVSLSRCRCLQKSKALLAVPCCEMV